MNHLLKQISTSLILIMFVFISCTTKADDKKDIKDIKDLFKKQAWAMEHEDINAYMSTIDNTLEGYSTAKVAIQKLLSLYDLEVKVVDIKIVKLEKNKATVKSTIIIKRISGPAFQNNKGVTTTIVKKIKGKWYMGESKIERFEAI